MTNIPEQPQAPSHVDQVHAVSRAAEGAPAIQAVRQYYTGPRKDQLVQDTRTLTRPTKKGVASDPLQSDYIGEPAEPLSATTEGQPFPPMGLAYYMTQAMMYSLQADSEMMQAYIKQTSFFYTSIETQWDTYAQKDAEFYRQEGISAFWQAGSALLTMTAAVVLTGVGIAKSRGFGQEQQELTAESEQLDSLTAEQSARAQLVEPKADEAIPSVVADRGDVAQPPLGDEGGIELERLDDQQAAAEADQAANRLQEGELSQRRAEATRDYQATKSSIAAGKSAVLNPEQVDDPASAVNTRYDAVRDDIQQSRDSEVAQAEAREAPAAEVEAIGQTYDRMLDENEEFRALDQALVGREGDLSAANLEGVNTRADAQVEGVEKRFKSRTDYLDEQKNTIVNQKKAVDRKLDDLKERRQAWGAQYMSLGAIPQALGQIGGIGQGVIKINQEAAIVKERDTADKIKSINQTALQASQRQWTTLANYVDGLFPAFVEAIRSYNQAIGRV